MTPAELWRAVGKAVEDQRHARKWRPIDVERAGGPTYKTVQAIEAGNLGNIESLEKCAAALNISIVDILHSILTANETPLSPEAAHLVRAFAETTVAGRQALLMMADALTRLPPEPPSAVGAPVTPRPPRPGPQEVKRRTGR